MCNCNRYSFNESKAEYERSMDYNGSEWEIVFIKCEHGKILLDIENNIEIK